MKTEVRRGRKFVEYHDDEQPEGTFTQEISGADVSYQDEQGNWLAADENWVTDGLDGFILKNDKLNHKVRLKGTGGRTWYPRRNVSTEYLTFGIPQFWNGKRWKNFGFNGYSVEGNTITLQTSNGVTILVHSRWNGIKIDWVLASSAAPSRMRYPVALTGITYIDGIIYGADGTELGRLTPTTATDSTFDEIGEPRQLPCSGSFANGYVEFQADVTGAVYPVVIDPDFAGGSSYGYVYGSNADFATAQATSTYSVTNVTIVGINYSSKRIYRTFLNFDTSSIGAGSTVTQVNMKLVATTNASSEDFDVIIKKQDWSGQSPLAAGNREAAYDGCLAADSDDNIWRNTSGMSNYTQYASGDLSTAWVNKTGTTYYSLISSLDYGASDWSSTLNSYVTLGNPGNATESFRPVLSVTYTTGSAGVPKHFLHYARLRSN